MKYIKLFKEELKPETYIRAGNRLKKYGKITRGASLTDYGTEKLYGNYNAHIGALNSTLIFTGEFTNLNCKFHYGTPMWNGPQTNVNSTLVKLNDEEELLSNWMLGQRSLSFTLEFDMVPTAKTNIKISKYKEGLANVRIPLFSMVVEMSDWNDGIRNWNYSDDDGDGYIKPGDERYMDVSDMYKNSKYLQIILSTISSKNYCGIFADRNSGLKFKKALPDLIVPYKSKIMDILSTVGGDTNDLENILEHIYSISINRLYQDEITPSTNTKNWFNVI